MVLGIQKLLPVFKNTLFFSNRKLTSISKTYFSISFIYSIPMYSYKSINNTDASRYVLTHRSGSLT